MGQFGGYIINEKDLKNQPSVITTDKLETILYQANNCICNIKCTSEGHGTGFFCKIPLPNSFNYLPVLITNNHILDKNDIQLGKTINFTTEKDTKEYEIFIDQERSVYTDEKTDITFIEIKNSPLSKGKLGSNI